MECWCLGSCRRSGLTGFEKEFAERRTLFLFADKVKLAAVAW